MHIHISWAVALVILLSWVVTVGAANMLAKARPNAKLSQGWAYLSTAA